MCQTVILCQKGPTLISQCIECRIINIWHNNVLLYFSPDDLNTFKNFTASLEPEECLFPFPDGQDRLILRTPNKDINFCFTDAEWLQFQIALEEAEYMRSIYEMLN